MTSNFSNINFEGIFDGKVIKNDLYDNKLLVYLQKISKINEKENIELIENKLEIANGIICRPLIKNQESITPEVGESILIFFFDGKPFNGYYINYNLHNKINDNSFISKLKENNIEFDIHRTINDLSVVYNKDDESYIINNDKFQVKIEKDNIRLFKDEEEIDFRPKGKEGQTYFVNEDNSSEIKIDFILHKGAFISNEEELKESQEKLSFKAVFDTWHRFSHDNTENQPANSSHVDSWKYNSSNDTIESTVNASTYIGFVSNEKYDNFQLDAKLKSNASDNDSIGIVIAFTKDSSGREYTLSAIRSSGGTSNAYGVTNQWALVYNFRRSDEKILLSKSISGDGTSNWDSYPSGTNIRIRRNGDNVEVWSAPKTGTSIQENTLLKINLSNDSLLTKFRGKMSYGFSCLSQQNSTFEDLIFGGEIARDSEKIYDMETGKIWVEENNEWIIDESTDIFEDIGVGKFALDETTKKLFFINHDRTIDQINMSNSSQTQAISSLSLSNTEHIFDKELGIPIWFNGEYWVNSSGEKVREGN